MSENFSSHFKLSKTQSELDFVDVPLYEDIPLFLDPLPLSQHLDPWSQGSYRTLMSYFQGLIDSIREKDDEQAKKLLVNLREPNETRLGYSTGKPQGAGIGRFQSEQILKSLKSSTAVKTGFLSSIEECELMIEGVGHDKISDLITNVLRGHLVEFSQQQCVLHNISMREIKNRMEKRDRQESKPKE